MNIAEINQRIEKVMKTDATFAREADFMITHVPFKKLYDFVPESGQTNFESGKAHYYINPEDYADKRSFDENELLIKFMDNPESHKFLLVQGNSGTGKSNLIRWIYYMYQKKLKEDNDDREQIIFIQRSYNSLKDAVKRILDYKILSADRTRYYLDKIGGGGQEATGEELAATVYAMLSVAVEYDVEYDQIIDEDVYSGLKVLLDDTNIKKYVFMKAEGPIERICKRISGNRTGNEPGDDNAVTSEMFIEKDFMLQPQNLMKILSADGHKASREVLASCSAIFQNPANRHSIVKYLNSKNEKVIARSSTLDATDVKSIFKEIRKELKGAGKNLTLFIEDINAYTGMDKALIEILIDDEEDDDNKKEMCRLKSMVGSTDNFYDLLQTSLKARISDSIVVLDESVLSDESKLLEFAAKYINAVSLSADQVDAWYYHNAEFPVADIVNRIASIEFDGKTLSIFPFTREAIINLFSCLDLNYRTPRGLLKYVIKHTLTNWNTMEDRIFETSTSFINVGIRSFSALKMPNSVRQSIIEMSEKEKQYIQIWGFDYRNNKIVNNTENEKELFRINVAESVDIITSSDTNKKEKNKLVDQTNNKRDRVLNSIEEWEKNIVPAFPYHKDLRDLIGKYILGQVNWEMEGVLYSKAAEVCKTLSFVRIEGQDGQGNARLILERTPDNANFFRALVYWNFDGDKKSWSFAGGMEEKIIAKVWLENHKEIILDAIKEFGRLDQLKPEYIVRAKLYSLISHGFIKSFKEKELIEALLRTPQDNDSIQGKNKEWRDLSEAMAKHDSEIDNLLKEQFCHVIGSSDVTNANYIFVDITLLRMIMSEVLRDVETGADKRVIGFGDKKLEEPVEVINIFQQLKDSAVSSSETIIRQGLSTFDSAFGKTPSHIVIANMIAGMQKYLNYLNRSLNQTTPPNIIGILEHEDTPKKLSANLKLISEYNQEQNKGEKLVFLSMINDDLIRHSRNEIEEFIRFMKDVDAKYTSNISKNIEQDIDERKKKIEKLVNTLISTGGAK